MVLPHVFRMAGLSRSSLFLLMEILVRLHIQVIVRTWKEKIPIKSITFVLQKAIFSQQSTTFLTKHFELKRMLFGPWQQVEVVFDM